MAHDFLAGNGLAEGHGGHRLFERGRGRVDVEGRLVEDRGERLRVERRMRELERGVRREGGGIEPDLVSLRRQPSALRLEGEFLRRLPFPNAGKFRRHLHRPGGCGLSDQGQRSRGKVKLNHDRRAVRLFQRRIPLHFARIHGGADFPDPLRGVAHVLVRRRSGGDENGQDQRTGEGSGDEGEWTEQRRNVHKSVTRTVVEFFQKKETK